MTYSPETQALLAAVMSGDVCSECSAPNGQRHFDECPLHPENVADTIAELRREVSVVTDERDAALLKVSELEGELHDLQERNSDIAAGIEHWHGKAVQS